MIFPRMEVKASKIMALQQLKGENLFGSMFTGSPLYMYEIKKVSP